MVDINASLRQTLQNTYTQRNPARHSTVAASTDSSAPATSASTEGSTGDAAADFRALFSPKAAPAVVTPPAPPPPPTAQSVFGDNPWIANPGGKGPNGITYGYNPIYFATPATAAKVAQMVGGTVVETSAITPNGPFQQNQPNEMVRLPNGGLLNAGIIASFYDHGYSQQYINMLVSNEVNDTTT
ncbi:MAG TPA: hypothetical protein VKJ01_11335 [Candidatus Solibacter sp.]|nr:hypothetical protein [Candidatus Solibacter sp.]